MRCKNCCVRRVADRTVGRASVLLASSAYPQFLTLWGWRAWRGRLGFGAFWARCATWAFLLLALGLLGACSTAPRGSTAPGARPDSGRDGPPAVVPPGLEQVPDAVPRLEAQRSGGPNKPYEVLGRRYAPLVGDVVWDELGQASWYGTRFHGRPTSSGEPYDMFAMTAAHKTLPIPSYVRVSNPANGREVVLRINDRGPFVDGRVIDLSYTAALKLGVLRGVAPVRVVRITHAEILAQQRQSERLNDRLSEWLP